ncbi:MAG TPA: hypothetical protein VG317_20270 [Pseudonocardiaceae bacterium]|nr:hypothetical protein [Pseudonocardiaceae bacterium]
MGSRRLAGLVRRVLRRLLLPGPNYAIAARSRHPRMMLRDRLR